MISVVYSYYNNPEMLKRQQEEWEKYPKEVKLILVDDCSSKFPVSRSKFNGQEIDLFRITKKVRYNFLACRNIAFHHAETKWVLNLDIDHIIPSESIKKILEVLPKLNEGKIYMFRRWEIGSDREIGEHGAAILLTKKLFWDVGGYDERLSGRYHGVSGFHHKRFRNKAGEYKVLDIFVNLYDNTVIPDAINTEFKKGRRKDAQDIKFRKIKESTPKVLTFPYIEL